MLRIGVGKLSLSAPASTSPSRTTNDTLIATSSSCSPCRLVPGTSMSHVRGLLTPVLVTLVGVGTGKLALSSPIPRYHPLIFCPGIAIFDPAFKQEKEQKDQQLYVSSSPRAHLRATTLPTIFLAESSSSKNSTNRRQKSRFARRRRPWPMLGEPLQYLGIRRGSLRSRPVSSVSR